ncbi:phosphoribosylformylglycinamidine cyclo-ligase [Candidatus Kaiserbacteria bacterium RIFCSPHIGHO2_12_FULL_53_13]|uniref:Phosphoribosylformylglycinamidine cyclo-ligase n=1 Tax=Candidatus Kaiserbacteria bacterium RIFCSPHIGHO2_12_FULL_53_13 TaxID=1798502 RepID=A0A1F6ED96_9BACT|nr:MAG: phosphoribosylformylglycinamidine cyclo-ligase [Candidatus Kaiserbacteria bacterium RIFCSPHIGHO2_12_FULL_53_13]OGG74720.1 MAG: phosphoribosylformylglycinamidine cyclo-ligase [Candidatus Kaiserbacteria bacterium RIFCSPLOWO2_01_FULL_52_36]
MRKFSYKQSGVDIDIANDTKRQMGKILDSDNSRVLNKIGAFATLFDGVFEGYKHPVLVLKTEEPGTKQRLALQNDSVETICYDLVGHLINDCIVMGAKPLSVQDCIVCGKMEKETILQLVSSLSSACKENGCVLTGGETSEQPGVVEEGTYILTASVVGVVDKENIIDGSKIKSGDIVLALASSGIHTNGFSLVRKLMEASPEILSEQINGQSFIKTILTPHRCYYNCLKDLFGEEGLVGLAHITGGGIQENLNRILPEDLNAHIDLGKIKILPIFKTLKKSGRLEDVDMLRTFNMGVGITAVVKGGFADKAVAHLEGFGVDAYEIGVIRDGNKKVELKGQLNWE